MNRESKGNFKRITTKFLLSLIEASLGQKVWIDSEIEEKLDILFQDLRTSGVNPREFISCQCTQYFVKKFGFTCSMLFTRKAGERFYASCLRKGRDDSGARRLLSILENRYGLSDTPHLQVFKPSYWTTLTSGYTQLIRLALSNKQPPELILEEYISEFPENFLAFVEDESKLTGSDFTKLLRIKANLVYKFGKSEPVINCLLVRETLFNESTTSNLLPHGRVPEEDPQLGDTESRCTQQVHGQTG